MPTATAATTTLFVTLVLAVFGIVVSGLRRARWGWPPIGLVAGGYLLLPAGLASAGVLDRYAPLPAPGLLLLFGLTLTTIAGALTRPGTKVIEAIPAGAIVLLQAFRIPVEWLLHRLYLEGALPVEMTYSGRNFDLVSGLTGFLLGAWLLSGRSAPRSLVLLWNVVGLGLLANVVTVAVLATPAPFRVFTAGPPNLVPSTFPFIWLPSFLVQVALASHLVLFRRWAPATRR